MKFGFIVFFTVAFLHGESQSIQQAIDDQVWKPFISTYNNRDTEGFMVLHSKDVVRSPRDAKMVLNWNEYYEQQKRGDEQGKKSGSKRQLGLRFTERIANDNQAIDVGVYKVTITDKMGSDKTFYGRFHVALRKENGIWKILVDTDSPEGGSIDEQDYMQASPMD